MAGRDNAFDMQIKLLMIGDSGKFLVRPLLCFCYSYFNRCGKNLSTIEIR